MGQTVKSVLLRLIMTAASVRILTVSFEKHKDARHNLVYAETTYASKKFKKPIIRAFLFLAKS